MTYNLIPGVYHKDGELRVYQFLKSDEFYPNKTVWFHYEGQKYPVKLTCFLNKKGMPTLCFLLKTDRTDYAFVSCLRESVSKYVHFNLRKNNN